MQSPVKIVFNEFLKPANIVKMEKLIYRLLKLKFRVAIVLRSDCSCMSCELEKKLKFGTIAEILSHEKVNCCQIRGIVEILEERR